MAFQKKTWLARLGQGLNKFIFNGGSKVTLDSSPDVVTQEGTPLSADNMNDLEQRIEDEFTNVNGAITSLIATEQPTPTYNTSVGTFLYQQMVVRNNWCHLSFAFTPSADIASYTHLVDNIPKPVNGFYFSTNGTGAYHSIEYVNPNGFLEANNLDMETTFFINVVYPILIE